MEIKNHPLIKGLDSLAESLPKEHRREFYELALKGYITGYEFANQRSRELRYEKTTELTRLRDKIINYLQKKSGNQVKVPLEVSA